MMDLNPKTHPASQAELDRVARRQVEQDYDPDPPRCGTCLYFTLGSWSQRAVEAKKGRGIEHLQRCTFGNFHTTNLGLCNEWRNKAGERLEDSNA